MSEKEYLTCSTCGDEIEDADAMELHEEVCIGEEASQKTQKAHIMSIKKALPPKIKTDLEEFLDEYYVPKSKIEGLVAQLEQRLDKVHDMGLCTGRDYLYKTLKEVLEALGAKETKK